MKIGYNLAMLLAKTKWALFGNGVLLFCQRDLHILDMLWRERGV